MPMLSDSQYRRFLEVDKWISENLNLPSAVRRLARPSDANRIRRAKIKAGGVGTDTLTCNLLDHEGSVIGTTSDHEITVYPVERLGTPNDLTGDVWPKLAAGDTITVMRDVNGVWYTTFIFDDTDPC